jgi:D-alanyl-D-alanine carboxypeptidase
MTDTETPRPIHRSSTWSRRRKLVTGLAWLPSVTGVASVAAPALAAPARATTDRSKSGALLQQALDEIVAAGSPGAIVLVRDGDRTIQLSSGSGNLAPPTPIRADDRTRIGGVTKSFTATVVLQLVGERKLALSDTVERWLPGVISNGDAITIRQLLNHTSGIFDYAKDPTILAPYLEGDFTHVLDPDVAVRAAADHGPLFAPGEGFEYSNSNYLLLAMIVEARTGLSLRIQLRNRIVEPLGLHHTTYPTSSRITGSYVHGYLGLDEASPIDVTPWSPTFYGAAGALVSNADDLAHFYRALLRGRLLTPGLLKSMQTIDPVATGGTPDAGILGGGWGLGLLKETFPCGEAWGHDSETPGYMAAAWNSKDGNRQVVVIVNSNFSHDEPVSGAMRNVLVTAYCGR